MLNPRSCESYDVSITEVVQVGPHAECHKGSIEVEPAAGRFSYRMKLGRETIWLDPVEYRILRFLAARPYHAYTRRRIADAVSTDRFPVMEEAVDRHVATLRDKLGFFWNYIQTVPYIGYRFKA